MSRPNLLTQPREAIETRLSEGPTWPLALLGYGLLAFAFGFERFQEKVTGIHPLGRVLLMLIIAAIVSWFWAWVWGGLYHLAARALGGKPGARDTVMAVGYAIVFPGLLLAAGNATFALANPESELVLGGGCLFFLVGFGWYAYNIVLAIRARHKLSWWRSSTAWLLATAAYAALVLAGVALVTL